MTGFIDPRIEPGSAEPLRVAIAGLGRSGWNIHAKTIRKMPRQFRITAAMDPASDRLDQAKADFGCRVTESFDGLLESDVDVVVIASPNAVHAEHAMAAMALGKHVVVEKPFAMSVAEADTMIEAHHGTDVVLAPFQNRRYEAHYRKVMNLVQSGALGEVLQIRMCWHRFTRRWDWRALRRYGGGALFNNGTHLLDQAMQFFEPGMPIEIFVDTRRGLSVGDADEHMKLVLRPESGPTVDIEYSNACAFPQRRWHIQGTGGGLVGDPDHLEWKRVDWDDMPERVVDEGPAAGRRYQDEEIVWQHGSWRPDPEGPTPYELFYADLFAAVRAGRSMLVTPESARRYLEVLDRCVEHIGALR